MNTFVPNNPENTGYFWVVRGPGLKPEMSRLYKGDNYSKDGRSLELWECPGIRRWYLDVQNMPNWMWFPISEPFTFL